MVFCTGCDGCGCVELGRELCALWKLLFDKFDNKQQISCILLVSLSSPYWNESSVNRTEDVEWTKTTCSLSQDKIYD